MHRQAWRSLPVLDDDDEGPRDTSLGGEDTGVWSVSAMQVITRLSIATRREETKVP